MLTTTVAGRTWNFSHAIGRGAAAGAGFAIPYAIASAPDGAFYVLSRGTERIGQGVILGINKRVTKVTLDEKFIGEFGQGQFTWPVDLAVDSDGNVYVSDEHENLISIFDPDGQKIGSWGEAGSGEGQISGPAGITFDDQDNLYVVDSRNNRVQKFTKDGAFLTSFGSAGTGDGQFNSPWGITLDRDGNLYVANFGNNNVQKFTTNGEYMMSFGVSSEENGNLLHPSNVAVDSEGDVYVVDFGNNRVQIYEPNGDIITALRGDGTEFSKWAKEVVDANPDVTKAFRRVKDMSPLGKFARPVGILVDDEDRVIISETVRSRLQVYEKEKNYMDPQFNL